MYIWKLEDDGVIRDQVTGDAWGENSEEFEFALSGEFEFSEGFVQRIVGDVLSGLTVRVE